MAYAHALIEVPVDPEDTTKGVVKYDRGDEVPADLPGLDYLREGGSVGDEPYDPEKDKVPAPDVVEIDGVKYVKASDGSEATDARV
jgi:hypothetical protein